MNNTNDNKKKLKSNNTSNHLFNNILLNQLNLEHINNKIYKNASNILLTPKSNSQRNRTKSFLSGIEREKKRINDYKTLNLKNSHKIKKHINNNILYLNHRKKMPNVIFKKYLLGYDIILPFNTIRDMPNVPYYTITSNFNEKPSFSPFRNKNKTQEIPPIEYNSNKTYNHYNNNKLKKEKIDKSKKESSILSKINNSNKMSLYGLIDIKNYSHKKAKNIKAQGVVKNKINSFTQIKYKKKTKFNSAKHKQVKTMKNDKTLENYKNEGLEYEDQKESITFNKAKELIDNPNSFIYLMFNSIKDQKFDEEGNIKKLDLKRRFNEYKKDLNKLEQKARFELFNLKKQRAIGNEINMKGRVISSNTFFNLAFGGC